MVLPKAICMQANVALFTAVYCFLRALLASPFVSRSSGSCHRSAHQMEVVMVDGLEARVCQRITSTSSVDLKSYDPLASFHTVYSLDWTFSSAVFADSTNGIIVNIS